MRKLPWLLPITLTLGLILFVIASVSAQDYFKATDLQIIPKSVIEGESVTITAVITNTTKKGGIILEVDLMINGKVIDIKEVTLAAGAS